MGSVFTVSIPPPSPLIPRPPVPLCPPPPPARPSVASGAPPTARLDLLQIKHLKRRRKSNYSVRETQTLIREIHRRRDVLFSRQQNTAINELKRRAWDEVAGGVNALGEGELRTAAEVKRRYLDWRALMKRKQLRAELALKGEYAPPSSSSPEHDASLGSGDQSVDLCGFPRDGPCDWQDLADLGEHSGSVAPPGVKMEDDEADGYRLDCDEGDGEGDEEDDCFPSLLSDIDRGEGRGLPEAYAHINEFGMLSASKGAAAAAAAAAAANISAHRDLPLGGWAGTGANAPGLANHEAAGHLVAMERQRVELERQRLAVERERLQLEKERLRLAELERERLQLERQRLQLERERLAMERERLQLERERLRVSLLGQPERADSSLAPPPQQGTPSSTSTSAHDGQTERERAREGEARPPASDLETERLRLEKERLQLEKERLQFFKFESGRLQIERERLQVEKERKQLHQDQGL